MSETTVPSAPRRRKPGRPKGSGAFEPTPEQRQIVELLTGYGIPQDGIVTLIVNPETKKPIDEKTLRERFKDEIARGLTTVNSKVVGALFKNATTPTSIYPGGNPSAQIFWAKARLGWRTTDPEDPGAGPPTTPTAQLDDKGRLEIARRIAFALEQAARKKALPKRERVPA